MNTTLGSDGEGSMRGMCWASGAWFRAGGSLDVFGICDAVVVWGR